MDAKTSEQRATEAAEALMSAVNDYGADDVAFAKTVLRAHPTLQQTAFKWMAECIIQWAERAKDGRFDGRNEATVKTCAKLKEVLEQENLVFKGRAFLPFI